jgi:hypothetical protein
LVGGVQLAVLLHSCCTFSSASFSAIWQLRASCTPRSKSRSESVLERLLPPADLPVAQLAAAMRYAALGGGKRLRAALVYATGEALGADRDALDAPAAAVELIHAYSLVHDDLPAMDDDDLRRGKPTCHRAFDEATAILAGDALQSLAFEVLPRRPSSRPRSAWPCCRNWRSPAARAAWPVGRRSTWPPRAGACPCPNWKPCIAARPAR